MNTIHIFYIRETEKIPDDIFQRFLLQLPEPFKIDINAYKHWESAQSSLLGKMLLWYGCKSLHLPYTLSDLQVGRKDRPFINAEIDFNISHSGAYVICAIVQNAKVGVDIEKHRKLKMNIADRYFDVYECQVIDASEQPVQAFFDFWSVKECAIKCDGRGVEVLSKTHVLSAANNEVVYADKVICDGNTYSYRKLDLEKNYSCSVCSNRVFDVDLHQLQLTDLV